LRRERRGSTEVETDFAQEEELLEDESTAVVDGINHSVVVVSEQRRTFMLAARLMM
jgi:hypothetical protein